MLDKPSLFGIGFKKLFGLHAEWSLSVVVMVWLVTGVMTMTMGVVAMDVMTVGVVAMGMMTMGVVGVGMGMMTMGVVGVVMGMMTMVLNEYVFSANKNIFHLLFMGVVIVDNDFFVKRFLLLKFFCWTKTFV